MVCNHSKAEQQEITSSHLNQFYMYGFSFEQRMSLSFYKCGQWFYVIKMTGVTGESCRSRTGSGKVHRLKLSAFWMSLCCHRFTWVSFASFAFFLAGSFPLSFFFKAFLFFDPVSEQLDPPGSFSYWSFFCSTWISPFFTSFTTSDTGTIIWFPLRLSILGSSSSPELTSLLFSFESLGG